MKHLIAALISAGIFAGHHAQAAEPYVAFNLGAAIDTPGDNSNAIPTVGVAFGLKNIAQQGPVSLRAEIEAQLSFQDETAPIVVGLAVDEQATTIAAFANLWFDYRPLKQTPLTLSVGGGVGLALTECDLCVATGRGFQVVDATDVNFAFNLGVAAAYEISPGWELGGTVRYYDYGTVNDETNTILLRGFPALLVDGSVPRRGVQALATLRYTFGSVDF